MLPLVNSAPISFLLVEIPKYRKIKWSILRDYLGRILYTPLIEGAARDKPK